MIRKRLLAVICAAVLCAILVAGLAPFWPPRNTVTWLGNENGLRFSGYATVRSSDAFPAATEEGEPSCSLEMWLQPGSASAINTILAFSTPENPAQLSVQQYHANLALRHEVHNDHQKPQAIGIDGVFRQIRPRFITISSGPLKTSVYVDGNLAETFSHFRLDWYCSGDLVIGTSPVENERWSGKFLGLAIYHRELSPDQVLADFRAWTTQGRPGSFELNGSLAIYLFNERTGDVIRNAVQPGINLYIPKRYSLVRQKFLEPFWKEFKPGRSYWSDFVINIVGFVPLGFVLFAYWSCVRRSKHAALITVFTGLATSLTIEILQSYLPTRASGTTDLITNTLGTFVGVKLCASKYARVLLAKLY
jgi:VanZ family protein